MKKALLSAACLGTTTVFAQVKDTLQTKNVDEVVMTASRKRENIKEVPSSITIVGEKQIKDTEAGSIILTRVGGKAKAWKKDGYVLVPFKKSGYQLKKDNVVIYQ